MPDLFDGEDTPNSEGAMWAPLLPGVHPEVLRSPAPARAPEDMPCLQRPNRSHKLCERARRGGGLGGREGEDEDDEPLIVEVIPPRLLIVELRPRHGGGARGPFWSRPEHPLPGQVVRRLNKRGVAGHNGYLARSHGRVRAEDSGQESARHTKEK